MLQLLINELSLDCLKKNSHVVFWGDCISKSGGSRQCLCTRSEAGAGGGSTGLTQP